MKRTDGWMDGWMNPQKKIFLKKKGERKEGRKVRKLWMEGKLCE